MPTAVIGALRVDLNLGTAGWKRGLSEAAADAESAKAKFQKVGAGITVAGAALTAGITVPLMGLLSKAIPAATESAQAMGQVEAALKSMGPAAGRTKEQLADAATELMHLSTFDDDEILRKVTANLLTFGTVAGEQFDRAQKAAVDLSTRMSGDLQASTLLVGKALNDPIKGMGALRKVGIQLTEQQQAQVKAFVAAGDAASAQGIILTELERQFGGSAKAMRDATPGQDLKNEWDDFTETVGAFALKVLPQLTSMLSGVLAVFNQLDPATQGVAVGALAIAAALGPVMMVVGPLVSGIGMLIPLFTGVAVAEGAAAAASVGLWAALAPALPIIAGIAAVVGAAWLAWENWDKIAPVLQGAWAAVQATFGPPLVALFETVKTTLVELWEGPFGQLVKDAWAIWSAFGAQVGVVLGDLVGGYLDLSKAIGEALGPVILGIIRGFIAFVGEAFKEVGNIINVLSALIRGDFSGAWTYLKKTVSDAVAGLGRIIEAMVPGALAALGRLVTGAKEALVNQLGAVFKWVTDKVGAVGTAFYNLYDAVVGHSYIPDMVDGIAAHMARLDKAMVDPAKKATKATKDEFKKLADDLGPLLDNLFPEARAEIEKGKNLDLIERARKAGADKGGLSGDQADEARMRLLYGADYKQKRDEELGLGDFAPKSIEPIEVAVIDLKKQLPELATVAKRTSAETIEAFAGMARDVVGSLRGMVSSFKGGDILGGLTSLLDIVVQVAGLIGGNSTPRIAAAPSVYGGGRALGGPVVPGKRYRVGERGPEWLEVGAPGRVVPDAGGGRRGGNTYYLSGNLMTPEFWDQIRMMDDGAAIRGAQGGAQLAQEQSLYARTRYLG